MNDKIKEALDVLSEVAGVMAEDKEKWVDFDCIDDPEELPFAYPDFLIAFTETVTEAVNNLKQYLGEEDC